MQDITQIKGLAEAIFIKERQGLVRAIEISYVDSILRPIATPAGLVEKRFRAEIPNYEKTGAWLTLEISIRDVREKNGNRIVVERLALELRESTSNGITGDILRRIPVQKLADECVLKAIEFFYPETRPNKKTSLKVPSATDVSMTEYVAATRMSLGLNPTALEIQSALRLQGVNLEEGTIRNYLTKAKKMGLLKVAVDASNGIPKSLRNFTPGTLSAESDLITDMLIDSAKSGKAPISPQEHRRRKADAERSALDVAARRRKILTEKRKTEVAKRNAPLKKTTERKGSK